ncbi:MFS transporter [Marinobacterium lutimaris]|uniref:MFS transporter, PPP family, 3-phenylpropionic acid transporter n=1 Tax=Marinobacterium lutimaris TaxID=568106 RepID=A0A1H5UR72_9GAMM|nr:MFS transporter [Marinobacterium lutimaris]SEF76941.1 MFS transporter, PPP family, 3-phenylpropionic acid transporter [Marinobacterium lutimaris]
MIPQVRLSGFYLFYFAFLGALVPYWSLYLGSFGFGAQTVGVLMGMLHATRILAPSLWGWLADRSGRRMLIVRLGACCAWLVFALLFWAETPLYIALVTLGFSFFWNAILAQFEVVTLRHLGDEKNRYSRIRVWGSIGFIGAVIGTGWLLDWLDIRTLPLVLLGLLVLIWLNTLIVGQRPEEVPQESAPVSVGAVMRQPQVIAFFAICFLVQFGHGPYYSFFSPMLESLGHDRSVIGMLWALGVIAEVVLFIWMHSVLERWSYRAIMLVSLWLSVLRWTLTALFPDQMLVLAFAQVLHAASFGSLHIIGIALVQHYFPPRTQGRGQAFFSSLGFGAGGFLGSVAAGYVWAWGGGMPAFMMSALACLVAIVLATLWIYPAKVQQNPA